MPGRGDVGFKPPLASPACPHPVRHDPEHPPLQRDKLRPQDHGHDEVRSRALPAGRLRRCHAQRFFGQDKEVTAGESMLTRRSTWQGRCIPAPACSGCRWPSVALRRTASTRCVPPPRRRHPPPLAVLACGCAAAGLRRHPPQVARPRRGRRQLRHPGPGRPWTGRAGEPVRHRICGADRLPGDHRSLARSTPGATGVSCTLARRRGAPSPMETRR